MFSQLIEAIKNADIITIISIIITAAVLFLVCMPTHEFAHAYAAYKLGDPTAKYQGRLTLNPLKHLDIFGFAMMLLLGFGYAKPVPVNMLYLKNRKRDMAIIAVAGPLMNFMTGVVFVFLSVLTNFIFSKIQINSEALFYIYLILDFTLETTAYISISLSIFNLIPIPPFDGSRIL
ncbi:MAG: site-2 protease family protein [Clostridia bacterium]|nr:site-2 protease family protein [Clostridia bacterium]